MNQIINTRNTLICFVSLLLASATFVCAANGGELLQSLKIPLLSATLGIAGDKENYTDETEGRALIKLRSFLSRLNKYPFEGKLDVKTNRNYGLARSKYNAVSTGGIDGWNYDIPFSMPIVTWEGDEPSVKYVDQDNYLIELNRYSNSKIVGYLVKDKVAYVVLSLADQAEFQILELVWSDRQLPYFNGYYFQISSDPIPATRARVFSPEFLKKLQAKLLAG